MLRVALVFLAVAAAVAAERPNIILMMADDLGWGDVGFHGNRVIRTPELDRMAAGGLRFERFYAAAPVCSPTRGSAITGRHPFRYGVYFANEGHMRPLELTLAELLREMGYQTGHFGKWHLGTLTKTVRESNRGGPDGVKDYSPPWENGFEVAFSSEAKTPTYDPMWKPKGNAPSIGWDWIRDLADAEPYGTHYWREDGRMVEDNLRGDDSRVIMDRAVPFIEQAAAQGKPFFAVIWFHTPHLPVVAGERHAALYKQYSSHQRNYYGSITAMDEQVGRLRRTLRTAGVARDTMVWFCSDNGPEGQTGTAPGLAGPFRGRKRSLYEGGIRVPGLVEWPARVKPGGKTDFPAVTSDYLPTILDVVGAKMPDSRPVDGTSLVAVLEGKRARRAQPIGFESRNQVALSGERYKLVGRTDDDLYELYDLIEDPGESSNLAAQRPDIVRRMKQTLRAWRESCKKSEQGADYRQ